MLRNIRANKPEQKNGWDNRKLKAYILERERAASMRVLGGQPKPLTQVQNCKTFNAHNWQRR